MVIQNTYSSGAGSTIGAYRRDWKSIRKEKNMHTYQYEFVDGHIIALVGPYHLLIDTGATFSVSRVSPLELAGHSHTIPPFVGDVSPDSLSQNIHHHIHALIGSDILHQYDIAISPTTHTLHINQDYLLLPDPVFDLDNFNGIPILTTAKVGDIPVRMFFDTGAKLSYLNPNFLQTCRPVSIQDDFYPGFGNFSIHIYHIHMTIGLDSIVLPVGNLPPFLYHKLMKGNTQGILGTAILQTHQITFSPRRNKMSIRKIDK